MKLNSQIFFSKRLKAKSFREHFEPPESKKRVYKLRAVSLSYIDFGEVLKTQKSQYI